MDEAAKTKKIRGPEFLDKYFSGKVFYILVVEMIWLFLMQSPSIKSKAMLRIFWIISNQVLLIACIAVIR